MSSDFHQGLEGLNEPMTKQLDMLIAMGGRLTEEEFWYVLACRLNRFRLAMGWSFDQLSKRTGIPTSTLMIMEQPGARLTPVKKYNEALYQLGYQIYNDSNRSGAAIIIGLTEPLFESGERIELVTF